MVVACPECESPVALQPPVQLSEIVECADCRTDLEVATVDPPMLVLAPEPEEDWGE